MRKKYYLCLLMLLVFFAFSPRVYGFHVKGVQLDTGEGGAETPSGSFPMGGGVTCSFKYYINVSTSITINTYDKDGKVTNNSSLTPTEKILAGTATDISINEVKSVSSGVTSAIAIRKATKITYYCHCKYKVNCDYKEFSIKNFMLNTCYNEYNTTSSSPCTGKCWETGRKTEEEDDSKISNKIKQQCRTDAEKIVSSLAQASMGPSYVVKLQDPNDINGKEVTNIYASSCSSKTSCSYTYKVNHTCMNVKTAKVRYITDNSKCNEDEIDVKGSGDRWKYFVPLNATSGNDNFFLSISALGKESKQSAAICKSIIDKYRDYKDLIIRTNSKQFTGNKSKDLALASDGCYLSSVMKIPVEQKFYGEDKKDDKNVLKGYAFYYQPIDINNPFPNSVGKDSYWYDWYKAKTKNPDLTKSFAKMTYNTGDINVKSVRAYNESYKYTSWMDMHTSGLSSFITDAMRVNVDKKSIYKLGCGPANKDWSECKK